MSESIKNLKRAVIREELVAITGDAYQALILDKLLFWTKEVNLFDKMILEEVARAEAAGKKIIMPLCNGWVFKKAEDLVAEIMIIDSTQTIRKKLNSLIEKGFVEEKNSPDYRFERTRLYKVNLDKISKELQTIGYTFDVLVGL